MRLVALAVIVSLAGVAPPIPAAEPAPVRAALVADRVPAGPGDVVRVGALLTLEPGWHVYWHNPGDAGLATEVTLDVAAGLEVGPLEWPVPISFSQPGDIAGYGYEGSVLLARSLREREGARFARPLPVRARVSWLACKNICVLGEARLEGDLGGTGVAIDPGAFAARSMPRPASASRVGVSTTRGSRQDEVTVWLRWPQPPRAVEWFPAPVQGLQVDVLRVATRSSLTRVDLGRRRVGDKPPGRVLPAVVVITDGNGQRMGFDLQVEAE